MSSLFDHLPSLKETVQQHELLAKKNLGQNFLLNMETVRRVARAAGDLTTVTVLEIGPGPGGLTRALLEQGADHLIVVEKDPRCLEILEEIKSCVPDRLTILNEDALTLIPQQLSEKPLKIAANLPYNIGTPLLIQWLHRLERIQSMTLMFQKEVALRIIAHPRTKAYGRLSILCQYLCEVEKVFDLPPGAFSPPPKVTSSVVHLIPKSLSETEIALLPFLEKITMHAFGQRRKMLRVSLKALFTETDLTNLGIAPTLRAEDLSIDEFVRLAVQLREKD